MPGGDLREQPGLTIHRDLLASDEITNSGGAPVTTALRTAWGLARWLPRPELQYPVYDSRGEFVARLDMAYPWCKLAIEYEGRGHLTAWQQESDGRRLNPSGAETSVASS